MFGHINIKRIKSPIVKYFCFLQDLFGMKLVDFEGNGYAWSHWSNGAYDIKICFNYGDNYPFSIYIFSTGGNTIFYDHKLVPPIGLKKYDECFFLASSWLKEEIPKYLDHS